MHPLRACHGPQGVCNDLHDFAFELLRGGGILEGTRIPRHGEGYGNLSLEGIGHACHGDLGDTGVPRSAFLDLARAQAMAGNVDHVVGTTQDEEVAIPVADSPVEGVVGHPARYTGPVGVDEALVVAPYRLHAP